MALVSWTKRILARVAPGSSARGSRAAAPAGAGPARHLWHVNEVAKGDVPGVLHRTYLEHRLIREVLGQIGTRWRYAADVGCGYGRNLAVLEEFADQVVGFEREPAFRAIAQDLHPAARVLDYPLVGPADGALFGFSMCFTFLQHLADDAVRDILAAVKGLTAGGHVLLVEDTGGPASPVKPGTDRMYRPRPVEAYARLMAPFKLEHVWPRPIEPTWTRTRKEWAGAFMLFSSPG
jgi:SAM-dependent methyltransferase